MKYEIKMLKSKNKVMKSQFKSHAIFSSDAFVSATPSNHKLIETTGRIRRGVAQHSLMDLMHDAIRLGIITHAEMTSQLLANFFVGSATDDAMRKYLDTLGTASQPSGVSLSNEGR